MAYYQKYLKYKSKFLYLKKQLGGALKVGDKVRELDSLIIGTIIEIHDDYGITHIVMMGDNGQKYDHNISHYRLLSTESKEDILNINTQLQKRTEYDKKKSGKLFEIGNRVLEHDSSMLGTVVKVHNNYGFTHLVMKGDDGKEYDHNITHYILVDNLNPTELQTIINKKEEEKEISRLATIESHKTSDIIYVGDRVIEYKSKISGKIIEIYKKYGIYYGKMIDDNNITYDKELSNYTKINSPEHEQILRKLWAQVE